MDPRLDDKYGKLLDFALPIVGVALFLVGAVILAKGIRIELANPISGRRMIEAAMLAAALFLFVGGYLFKYSLPRLLERLRGRKPGP